MPIIYTIDDAMRVDELIDVFNASGIRRPTHDPALIQKMIDGAGLFVTARLDGKLIGVARSLTDRCYATYLSDLAVSKAHQHQGIGIKLIEKTREAIGGGSMLLLLAAPEAVDYYPKIGFNPVGPGRGWMMDRQS